jgi:hypothetical protein
MPDDPIRYWQDLTENYRQMSDGELLELADKPEDLTDVARQALRDEMNRRRLEAPADNIASKMPVTHSDRPATVNWEPARARYLPRENEDETDVPHEYTWKTDLCECNTRDEALDLGLILKNAGIDSWISTPESKWGLGGPRIQVAADQLEQAQMILAHYTPPARVNEAEQEIDEFILPVCPGCGSKEDAVLQAADPVNAWMCEACGAEWTDPEAPGEEGAAGRD